MLALLQDTGINYLVVEASEAQEALMLRAGQQGITTARNASPPDGIEVIAGVWPGIKLSPGGAADTVAAGPTGAPWIDSNGWTLRLAKALRPETNFWVDGEAKDGRLRPKSYLMAIADAASRGGRWILSLDKGLAAGVAAQEPEALRIWKSIGKATRFFNSRSEWADHIPRAVLGVVSNFSGQNEFLSHEVLNLLERANIQYLVLPKTKVSEASFSRLKALLYVDQDAPGPDLRTRALEFAERGGLLITVNDWGSFPGTPATRGEHPRYDFRLWGKGRLAIARPAAEDPYALANDSAVLISHRHDLLRFWNGGAIASYLTMALGGRKSVLQMLFFSERGVNLQRGGQGDAISVRVAGGYRAGSLLTLDGERRRVEMRTEREAVELHLPPLSEYAAVELDS
jgi:hypothetical protein